MKKIFTTILFITLIHPKFVLAESCSKMKEHIIDLDKQQMSLKHPKNKKSLAKIQEEHDQLLAEMLFYHGLVKAKQQYQALISNYENQRDTQIAKSVDEFKKANTYIAEICNHTNLNTSKS